MLMVAMGGAHYRIDHEPENHADDHFHADDAEQCLYRHLLCDEDGQHLI